jgi:single-stranded-DNA-specific exonuclease
MLAGVGIVYKLVKSLSKHFPSLEPEEYLDLVAIGTIADIVPLISENRYLAKQGLVSLNQLKRQSLVSLLGAANILGTKIRSSDISFQIGPRLNAAGRLGQAETALNLLISTDPNECGRLAQQLENDNYNRKIISQKIEQKALEIIRSDKSLQFLITVFEKTFNSGVSGIVAGSLARKFNLPVIIGQIGDEYSVASCRSIPEFDLTKALDHCKELLVRYGGHSQAAGFTILNSNLPKLKERLLDFAATKLSGIDLTPSIDIDAEVQLEQLDENLIEILDKIEPTGAENKEVVFMSRDLHAANVKAVGQDKNHLKMLVSDGSYSLDAIGFGLGDQIESIPPKFDALFNFQLNEFRGKITFQLNLIDLRPC